MLLFLNEFLKVKILRLCKIELQSPPMVKSHYNILFLYLGYKGMSFSQSTLENHTKKIIQKQKQDLRRYLHVSLSTLYRKLGLFQEGSHLELHYFI